MTRLKQKSSESVEWYTPPWVVEKARRVVGPFTLDPATCDRANQIVKAENIYTKEMDGLSRNWRVDDLTKSRIWLNPPYGRGGVCGIWVNKLMAEIARRNVEEAMLLVNSNTSSQWFHGLWSYPICFFYKRLKFISEDGQQKKDPTHANCLVYLGKNWPGFDREFGREGHISWPVARRAVG